MKILFLLLFFMYLNSAGEGADPPWKEHGKLEVADHSLVLRHDDGTPFLWLGCTAWGMTEWLSREEVDLYLDDRKSKGMNVVQLCLFWGKRTDYPTRFTANAPNFYGFKALHEVNGLPDPSRPAVVEGGSPMQPNDYWDHVDYCLEAIKKRGMYAAVLPFWGRRYVNASHTNQSLQVFTMDNISDYGIFLGKRYGSEPNIIWVSGGDVSADTGGDYLKHYRRFAEGLVYGAAGKVARWNENSEVWDEILMTYHPDGNPMRNSSEWFHSDPWLDFNMIETYLKRDYIVQAVKQDLNLDNPKPSVLAEPQYEGLTDEHKASAIHMRRQAYQSFFAGAAGFTYGGAFNENGNGPLFSPSNNWIPLLEMSGAEQMKYVRRFLEQYSWGEWENADEIILSGKGTGETEKLAVRTGNTYLIYFPDQSGCKLDLEDVATVKWYNTSTGEFLTGKVAANNEYTLPENLEDGILIIGNGSN